MSRAGDPVFCVHGNVILPDRILADAYAAVEGDSIAAVSEQRPSSIPASRLIDAANGYIAPGFVDIHVHGGGGADYMDGTVKAVRTANRAHAGHGVTTIFPTT